MGARRGTADIGQHRRYRELDESGLGLGGIPREWPRRGHFVTAEGESHRTEV